MAANENKTLGIGFFQEQDRLRGGPADDLCAPTYTAQIGSNPPMDLAGHKQFAQMFYGAFPDLYHAFQETIAGEDGVAVHFTLHGTHTGDFMGIPATGKQITLTGISIDRIAGGKFVERWDQADFLGLMQQLGAVPSPEQNAA